jgi:hypothetical protein
MQEEQRSVSSICLFSFSSSIDGTGDLTFSWNNHGNPTIMQMKNLQARFQIHRLNGICERS